MTRPTPTPQPRKETTSRPWNRRPPDATAGQAPHAAHRKPRSTTPAGQPVRPGHQTREGLRLNVLLTCAKLLGAEFSNRTAFPHASGLRLVHHAVREPDGLHRSNEAPAS